MEHAINNILYDADMGKYNPPNPSHNEQFTSRTNNLGHYLTADYLNNRSLLSSPLSVDSSVSHYQHTPSSDAASTFSDPRGDMPLIFTDLG